MGGASDLEEEEVKASLFENVLFKGELGAAGEGGRREVEEVESCGPWGLRGLALSTQSANAS